MARIRTITVDYGRKFNLGDFNSAEIKCGAWIELEEGDDVSLVMEEAWQWAKDNVKKQVPAIEDKADVKELYLGLPTEIFSPGKEKPQITEGEEENAD